MKKLLKRRRVIYISFVFLAAVFVFGYFYSTRDKQPRYDIFVVKRADVVQEVSVTGKTEPTESVELAFEKTGQVRRAAVDVGDKAASGQILVELESSELQAQLAQAVAAADAEQAKLDELESGSRPEDIAVKRAELEKAEQDLTNAYSGVVDILRDAYTKSDDATRAKTASMFSYLGPSYILTFSACAGQTEIDVTSMRVEVDSRLSNWLTELNLLNASSSRLFLDEAIVKAGENLTFSKTFLERANSLLITGCTLNDTKYDSYRTNVNAARANIVSALTNVSNVEQSTASQKRTVARVQNELDLKLAGARPEEIAAQQARLREAEAKVALIRAQLAKTILRSPINGIVTRQDATVGEIVSANAVIVSLISEAQFEIAANVPEADIAKIKAGDSAKITLDAYGPEVIFEAHVSKIDPAETIIEGVATYKTTLQFNQKDERIKSGMTANIDIVGDIREKVIVIPQRSIITRNGGKLVRILNGDGTVSEVRIQTGLRGSDGMTEIILGVNEGDRVIISAREE